MRRRFVIGATFWLFVSSIADGQTSAPATRPASLAAFEDWLAAAARKDADAVQAKTFAPKTNTRLAGGRQAMPILRARVRAGEFASLRAVDVLERGDVAHVFALAGRPGRGPTVVVAPMARIDGEWKYVPPFTRPDADDFPPAVASGFRALGRESARFSAEVTRRIPPEQFAAEREFKRKATALGQAIAAKDAATIDKLLADGANPDTSSVSGPLARAILDNDVAFARRLIAAGARPYASWVAYWLEREPNPAAIRLAIELGLDPNAADLHDDGMRTPLHLVVAAGDASLARWMLERGGRVDDSTDLAMPYLSAAAMSGDAATFRLVADRVKDWRAADVYGENALHAACLGPQPKMLVPIPRDDGRDRPAIIADLLRAGLDAHAKVEVPRKPGIDTPLKIAADNQRDDAIAALLAAADFDADDLTKALALAARECDAATLAALIKKGARPSDAAFGADDALRRAIDGRCDVEAVRVLLDGGAPIDRAGRWGRTPLHQAISRGDAATVRLLLERGASVDARDVAGRDARTLARRRVELGVDYSDDANVSFREDETPEARAESAEIARLVEAR